MTAVWFTADTHFGHRSMIQRGWRPQFASVEEMNEVMIERWNAVVRTGDQVWHLGDFGLGGQAVFLRVLDYLNGHKHLITGNHDHVWPGGRESHKFQKMWIEAGWESIQQFARRRIAGQDVMLSHFPYVGDHQELERYEQYRLRDQGLWLIHGHVHTEWKVLRRMINVGVDQWGFTPVSLEEIVEIVDEE